MHGKVDSTVEEEIERERERDRDRVRERERVAAHFAFVISLPIHVGTF